MVIKPVPDWTLRDGRGKIFSVITGGSSNGRTADSGSVCRGSNPLPPAKGQNTPIV
jgi:hypothetical protein